MAVRVCVNISATTLAGGEKASDVCVCVCARACTSVYLCIYVVLSHFNHTEQDLLSGVLELDFFLPDLDETVHVLLCEAAQLNQDETSNPPPLVTGTVNTPQQMEEFRTRTERVCHHFFCFIWK